MGLGTSHMTITTGSEFIPTLWAKEIQRATESALVAAQLVKRFDSEVSMGDTLRIPTVSNFTANVKTAGAQVTFNGPTDAYVTLTINKHYEASMLVEDNLQAKSKYSLIEAYREKMPFALATQIDTDVLGLYASITQFVGTAGQAFDDGVLLDGIKLLDDAVAPQNERYLVHGTKLKREALAIDKYLSSDYVGDGDLPTKTGLIGQRNGIMFYMSQNVPNSGGPINQLFHREGLMLGMQKDISVEKGRIIEYTADAYVTQAIYGVGIYRNTFNVKVLN